jgi:hypothetical protein
MNMIRSKYGLYLDGTTPAARQQVLKDSYTNRINQKILKTIIQNV